MRLDTPVLVTGSTGMLGSEFVSLLSKTCKPDQLLTPTRSELDITQWKQIGEWVQKYRPGTWINCAAYTNVDEAQIAEREQAFNGNVVSVANLAEWCGEFDIKLIHFSTDQVFDGTGTIPRTEEDPTNPLNYYAETKLQGEQEALTLEDSLVFRVQWLYGERKDRFTPLKQKEVFSPFADQFGAPMPVHVVAKTVLEMIEKDASGLFHLSWDDYASWAEVFQFVKEEWKLPVRLEPKSTAEMQLPAPRPLFSVLSNAKLRNFLKLEKFGSWKTALRDFLHS